MKRLRITVKVSDEENITEHTYGTTCDIKNMINNICYGCSYNGSVCCKYLVERK